MITSHDRGELFKELVRAARCKSEYALARVITDVHEGVAHSDRDMHKAACLAAEHLITELHFVAALQEIDRFVLMVVNVQRRPAFRLHVEHQDIQCSVGIVAGYLVDQSFAGDGVAQQAVIGG